MWELFRVLPFLQAGHVTRTAETKFWLRNVVGRDHLENQDVDGGVIAILIFKNIL
jgi:hypothetical protein